MARKPSPKPKHVAHSRKAKPSGHRSVSVQSIAELDAKRAAFDSHFEPYIVTLPERATRPVGRPTLYDPAFCDEVIRYGALGHTIGATAGMLGVTRETVQEWASSHPEFGRAVARAKTLRQAFYEGHLIDIARRGGDSTRMSAIKLGLLNVGGEDWKERLTSDHNVTFSLASLINESMKLVEAPKDTIEGIIVDQPDKPGDEP